MDDAIQIRLADLMGWALIVVCSFALLFTILSNLCSTAACWRFLEHGLSSFASALYTFVSYFSMTVYDILRTLLTGLQHLPYAWYVFGTLTLLPICTPIRQDLAVLYLILYCVTGLYICAFTPFPKKKPPPPTKQLGAHLFSELRITSVE